MLEKKINYTLGIGMGKGGTCPSPPGNIVQCFVH